MKTTRMATQSTILVAAASLVGLTGCTTYVDRRPPPPVVYSQPAPVPPPPPQPVYVEPSSVEVVIRDERDFYEPLSPYGRWEYVGNYGRCWVPARVESDWRPYSNGHWERTDAGWYWVSDEPWGWATYHYGRWDFEPRVGWFWIPQTMWAPAWVTWHRGGGYIGWSPLPPSASIAESGIVEIDTRAIPRRGYVFVEEGRFLEPIRPTTVVNNTTIINNTVNITNVKVVNNTVINEGPRTQVIEQVSGRKLRSVPARELRRKIEAPVAASHRTHGGERDLERTTQPAQATPPPAPVAGSVTPRPSQTEADARRKAAELRRQEQIQSNRRAQEQQRKAQAEAERLRAQSERSAKLDAERRAQADGARIDAERRQAEHKAQLEAEQQRAREQAGHAQAEASRRKHEADLRAPEQAGREARQKQAQMEEARRKQELDRKAQAEAQNAARHAQEQKGNRKGQSKKAVASQPVLPGTNAPIPLTNPPARPPQ